MDFKNGKLFILLILMTTFAASCGSDSNPFNIEPPDLTTVPPPVDTTGAEMVELADSLVFFRVRPGEGEFSVVNRDNIRRHFTLRSSDGEVIRSSYADGNTTPRVASVQASETEGLRRGLLGMKEGEIRVIVVPPPLGFENIPVTSINFQFREDTLIYEVELFEII